MSLVKTRNLPTLRHSHKEETLTLLPPSHLGRSDGRSLLLGHAPCVMSPHPEGRGSKPVLPLLPRRIADGQFLRLRPASLGASTLPPPAPAARRPPGGPLCACALALPPSCCARLSQSVGVCPRSRRSEGASESQLPDYFLSPPSLPPHISLHPSPALGRAAMAEPSAATQSPSVSSSSSGAEPSAPGGGGGSPGACPALGAKSCGSSCAGEARRGTPPSGGDGGGQEEGGSPFPPEAAAPGDGRLEMG